MKIKMKIHKFDALRFKKNLTRFSKQNKKKSKMKEI